MSRSRMRRTTPPQMPGAPKRVKVTNAPPVVTDYQRAIRNVVLRDGFPVDADDAGYYGPPIDIDAWEHVRGRRNGTPCPVSVPDTAVVDERSIERFNGTFTSDTVIASLYLYGASCTCGRWNGTWADEASLSEIIREVVAQP